MPVPKFHEFLLPILEMVSDGAVHRLPDLYEPLAARFHLSNEDRRELLPSGTQARFENRVTWARTYLAKAGLVLQPGRGRVQVTDRGKEVLGRSPSGITQDFLMQFEEFRAFKNAPRPQGTGDTTPSVSYDASPSNVINSPAVAEEAESATPEERLADAYATLRQQLANDLLDRLAATPPAFFERLVVRLIVAMGYGGSLKDAGEAVGRSGDGGIDGIIKEDKLGLDAVYIQAKRWSGPVGRPDVQSFAGSLEGARARKGIMITTSQFSQPARDYVRNIEKKIVLIDGPQLAAYMIDHYIGVSPLETYVVCKVDDDYFESD